MNMIVESQFPQWYLTSRESGLPFSQTNTWPLLICPAWKSICLPQLGHVTHVEHMAHVFSVTIKQSFPIVAMLIPSLDDLARQLYITRPALVGTLSCKHIVDLRECAALRATYFGRQGTVQPIIVYLNAQVLGRMAPRTWLHGRHSSSPLSLRIRSRMSPNAHSSLCALQPSSL